MSSDLLNKAYEPHAVEKHWYGIWEKEKLTQEDLNELAAYMITLWAKIIK